MDAELVIKKLEAWANGDVTSQMSGPFDLVIAAALLILLKRTAHLEPK